MEESSPGHCLPGEPVDVSDLRQYSEKSDAEYLDSLSDYVSKNRYKILTLESPTNVVLRIANLDDTIYKERLDEVNGWGKFYLPKIVKMQVLGVVEGTSCPCDQLVLMTCEDKKLYAYDGEDLHLVASSLTCLCDKGIEYPASKRYYNGEAFKDMTNEDWEKVREGDVGKKLDEEHKKLVMEKKPRLMQNLAASRKKHKSVTKLKMDLGSASDKLRDVRKEFVDEVTRSDIHQLIMDLERHGVLRRGKGYKIVEEGRRRYKAKELIDTVIQRGDKASERMMICLRIKYPELYSSLFTDEPSSSSVSKMKMHLGSASASDWSLRSASDKLRDVRKEFVDNLTWSQFYQLITDLKDFTVLEPYHRFRRFGMTVGRRNKGAERIFHIMKCGDEKMKIRLKSKYPELYSFLFTDEPFSSVDIKFAENVSQSQLDWIINELEDHGVLRRGKGYKIVEEGRRRYKAKKLIDTVIQRGDKASARMMIHLRIKYPELYFSLFTDEPSSSSVSKMKMHLGSASASDWSLRSASDKLRDVRKEFVDNMTRSDIHQLIMDLEDHGVLKHGEGYEIAEERRRRDEAEELIDTVIQRGDKASERMMICLKSKYPELYSSLFTDEPSSSSEFTHWHAFD